MIKKVLILDDEETLIEMYQQILEKHFPKLFEIYAVNNGDEALKYFKTISHNIDLFISDIMHPGLSIFDLIKIIPKERSSLKTMILSYATDLVSTEELNLADVVLKKPVTEKVFINTVKLLL